MEKNKVVVFQGGLGNQLFQYSFLSKFREDGYNTRFLNDAQKSHNGFEIGKYFVVDMMKCSTIRNVQFRLLKKLYQHGFKHVISTDNRFDVNRVFQVGYWQERKYFPREDCICFKRLKLDARNESVLSRIDGELAVAIHIRRGDYLLPPHNKRFAGICTKEYYEKAISIIEHKFDNPLYLFFSNDMKWVRENFNFPESQCIFVDWNTGNKSIFDMYLMSRCKAIIMANSTFSYWGARLGKDNIVIYPQKWFQDIPAPDIFPLDWLGI